MKQDEPSERTREEAVERWKKRGEQDQRRSEELEREPWRMSKKIKAQDPYHFMIIPTLIERLSGTGKIVIDKLTESITVERRYLLLIHRQRVIPFSAIRSVVIDYKYISGEPAGGSDRWTVFLNTHDKKVKIFWGSKEDDMFDLASAISKIIRKEVEYGSDKPDPLYRKKVFDKGNLPSGWKL